MIDLHAHILPGLDDGASSLEEALAMAGAFLKQETATVAATPHFVVGSLEPRRSLVLEKTAEINRLMAGRGGFRLLPGMEVQVDPQVPELLAAGRLLTLNDGGKYLLLELPFISIPDCTRQVIFLLGLRGVTALIAHPERNREITGRPQLAGELVQAGALLQVNGGSLLGHFGPEVRKAALTLLAAGQVHVVAGDAHRATGGRRPCLEKVREFLVEEIGRECADLLLEGNPAAVLSGGTVSFLAPWDGGKIKKSFFSRFFSS